MNTTLILLWIIGAILSILFFVLAKKSMRKEDPADYYMKLIYWCLFSILSSPLAFVTVTVMGMGCFFDWIESSLEKKYKHYENQDH